MRHLPSCVWVVMWLVSGAGQILATHPSPPARGHFRAVATSDRESRQRVFAFCRCSLEIA
eukprot:5382830-Prymnesium_polylepis.1